MSRALIAGCRRVVSGVRVVVRSEELCEGSRERG